MQPRFVEVLGEDVERVFCGLLQKDANGYRQCYRHAFVSILAGAEQRRPRA
jgi:DNA-binding ferritin-like protein (Dps family)